jgi:hypothetical protein
MLIYFKPRNAEQNRRVMPKASSPPVTLRLLHHISINSRYTSSLVSIPGLFERQRSEFGKQRRVATFMVGTARQSVRRSFGSDHRLSQEGIQGPHRPGRAVQIVEGSQTTGKSALEDALFLDQAPCSPRKIGQTNGFQRIFRCGESTQLHNV